MIQQLIISEEEILNYHLGGKIGVAVLKELSDKRSLSIAYTPGVATPCLLIKERPDILYKYSARGNLVAVVTDGSAVLGLGDIGARASVPVMEGKAILFKQFAKVDAWPVPLENCRIYGQKGPTDLNKFVEYASSLACMYGGINLEDIAAPACFEIEEKLQENVDSPVFHDDQWGTAIITLAALKNYILLSGKDIENLSVVINGAGAAGIRIAETIRSEGVRKLLLLDSKGVIHNKRADLNKYKEGFCVDTTKRTLADALKGADVFIGVSRPNLLTQQMITTMAEYPAIFAMANPRPEIMPEEVAEVMGQRPYIMATGRSDYSNQINNVLGFPYIFRGALDVRAKRITMQMKKAAAESIANVAQLNASDHLKRSYPDERLSFSPEYIIPKPFDERLIVEVSYAVADAALQEGVSEIKDITFYRQYLEALAYAPKQDSSIPFIIEGFCKFGEQHTICLGHTPEGSMRSFLCDPQFLNNYVNDKFLPGTDIKLIIKKGLIIKIL